MKLFLLLIFIFFTSIINAQQYYTFPTSNAIWREYRYELGGSSRSYYYDFQNFINGDTLIEGKIYHKIYQTGYTRSYILYQSFYSEYEDIYVGAIREDSLRKVYYYVDSLYNEQLLYDFNLNIGDTLPIMVGTRERIINNNTTYTVTGIDSILVQGNFHKRFQINYPNQTFYIIEGVGSTYGLLAKLYSWTGYTPILKCFKLNDENAYPDGQDCNLIHIGIDEFSEQNKTHLFPNPGNGIFYFNNLPNESLLMKIFNLMGNKIFETIVQKDHSSIDLSNLPKGIYFIQIIDKNESINIDKIVIQ